MTSPVCIVVPSLKITGGTKEIVTLARDIVASGGEARIVVMWRTPDEVTCSPIPVNYLSTNTISPVRVLTGIPAVAARFVALKRRQPDARWVLSHYVTYALAPLVSGKQLWFFVQDLEWTFVPARLQGVMRRFILATLTRGRTLAANSYLAASLAVNRVPVAATIPIWASPAFRGAMDRRRDVNVVLMMRRGAHKRVDLAQRVLAHRQQHPANIRMAVITPNNEFAEIPIFGLVY